MAIAIFFYYHLKYCLKDKCYKVANMLLHTHMFQCAYSLDATERTQYVYVSTGTLMGRKIWRLLSVKSDINGDKVAVIVQRSRYTIKMWLV